MDDVPINISIAAESIIIKAGEAIDNALLREVIPVAPAVCVFKVDKDPINTCDNIELTAVEVGEAIGNAILSGLMPYPLAESTAIVIGEAIDNVLLIGLILDALAVGAAKIDEHLIYVCNTGESNGLQLLSYFD